MDVRPLAYQVRYALKTPYRDGTTHIVLEPLDFIARLAALARRGDDPKARYRFFRRLLAVAQDEAGGRQPS